MKTFFKKVPPRAVVFALLLAALLAGTEAVLGSAEERCWVENAPGGEALQRGHHILELPVKAEIHP